VNETVTIFPTLRNLSLDQGPRITPLCGDKIDELENPAASLQRRAVRKTFCPARSCQRAPDSSDIQPAFISC
jgi:hypothetical protein